MSKPHTRTFDFLYREICVALNRRISRYQLWLFVTELGFDTNELSHDDVVSFVENGLSVILERERQVLETRTRRQLQKRLLGFDPRYPTPEEWLMNIGRSAA